MSTASARFDLPFHSGSRASDLVGLIYQAAVDPSRYPAFLKAYAEAVGGAPAFLVSNSGHSNETARLRWFQWTGEDAPLFADRETAEGLYQTVGDGQPEGAVRAIDLSPGGESQGPKTRRRWYAMRGARYGLAGVFLRAANLPSVIVAARREQDGPFALEEVAILRSLMPHLRQAAVLESEVSSLRVRLAVFTHYLDRSPCAFLLTDPQGRIIFANAAVTQIAALKDGLAITSGRLSVTSVKNQVALTKAIEQAATAGGPPLCRLEVERPSRKPPYRLLLMPAASSGAMQPGLLQAAALVVIIDSAARTELDPEFLRELFSLTPAEARVAGQLTGGRSAEEIASRMDVSVATVRTHIRRVLSKTGTRRQGELIALLLRTVPFRRP